MTRLHNIGAVRVRFEEAAPPPVTQESVNTAISAAMANLLSKDLPLAFKPLNDQFTSLAEKLTALTPPKKEDVAPPPVAGASPEMQSLLLEHKRTQEKLKADLELLTNENKASKAKAEVAERKSAIDSALNEYQFASPKAREAAFKLINMEVKRSDDGALIAGDLTLETFTKQFLTVDNDHLLKGVETAGTGASKGTQRGTAGVATLEDIGPNMTAEKRAQVFAAIQAARG